MQEEGYLRDPLTLRANQTRRQTGAVRARACTCARCVCTWEQTDIVQRLCLRVCADWGQRSHVWVLTCPHTSCNQRLGEMPRDILHLMAQECPSGWRRLWGYQRFLTLTNPWDSGQRSGCTRRRRKQFPTAGSSTLLNLWWKWFKSTTQQSNATFPAELARYNEEWALFDTILRWILPFDPSSPRVLWLPISLSHCWSDSVSAEETTFDYKSHCWKCVRNLCGCLPVHGWPRAPALLSADNIVLGIWPTEGMQGHEIIQRRAMCSSDRDTEGVTLLQVHLQPSQQLFLSITLHFTGVLVTPACTIVRLLLIPFILLLCCFLPVCVLVLGIRSAELLCLQALFPH